MFSFSRFLSVSCLLSSCRLEPAGVHGLTLALFRPLFSLHSEVRVPSCARQSVTVRLYVCLTPSRPNIQTSSSGLPTTPSSTEGELLLLPLIIFGAWCTASATHRTSENLRGTDSDGVDTKQISDQASQRAESRGTEVSLKPSVFYYKKALEIRSIKGDLTDKKSSSHPQAFKATPAGFFLISATLLAFFALFEYQR